MVLNIKKIHNSFWRNFPGRAKQMPSTVIFVGKKSPVRSLGAKIVIVDNSNWVKIIIFVFNYLTVVVYTKTDEGSTSHLHFSE